MSDYFVRGLHLPVGEVYPAIGVPTKSGVLVSHHRAFRGAGFPQDAHGLPRATMQTRIAFPRRGSQMELLNVGAVPYAPPSD